jgi:hypothetical protein
MSCKKIWLRHKQFCEVKKIFTQEKNIFLVSSCHSKRIWSSSLITSIFRYGSELKFIKNDLFCLPLIFQVETMLFLPNISFSLWYTCRRSRRWCTYSYMNSHRTSCWWIFLHLLECSFHYLLRSVLACLPACVSNEFQVEEKKKY